MDDTKFDDFWRASELDTYTVADFARRLATYSPDPTVGYLEYSAKPTPLPSARTVNSKIAKKRQSSREFNKKPLSAIQLAKILGSFRAQNGSEHRNFPAAGAVYCTEIFQVIFNSKRYDRRIIYYNPEAHGVVELPLGAPTWKEAQELLNIDVEGVPQSLILFISFPGRAVAKYGERGGRFALLEAGAAMQQLALTIAEDSKLKGVAVGGTMDARWLDILGLSATDARIVLGYLVGR